MDPWYFLDIELVENDDYESLEDCWTCDCEGGWEVDVGGNWLKYNNFMYSKMVFDNIANKLSCYAGDTNADVYVLRVERDGGLTSP